MKTWLRAQGRRINNLTLRERAILFVSASVALVGLADALVYSPRLAERKALATELRQLGSELDTLRTRLGGAAESPQQRLRQELQTVQQRLAEVDGRLQQGHSGAQATRLPQLLEQVLRRHEKLTLLRLATLAPAAPAQPGAPALQEVEIALAGTYPELMRYVAAAEQALPGLRWGELRISTPRGTPELVAQVALPGGAP